MTIEFAGHGALPAIQEIELWLPKYTGPKN